MQRGWFLGAVALLVLVAAAASEEGSQERHDTWAVKIASDGVVESLRQTGLIHMGAVFEHTDEYHVFKMAEHHDVVTTAQALEAHEGVEWFRHQVPRVRKTRFVGSDPLYAASWFLHDNPGVDLNVEPVWDEGWTGAGVQIAIVDEGVNPRHPDIAANYKAQYSYDFNFNKPDASSYGWISHGTTMASLVAGEHNTLCSVGVAFGAGISSIRIASKPSTDTQEANALRFDSLNNDIYVNAWGPPDDAVRLEGPGPLAAEALKSGAQRGRGGLGSIFVWAAGNGGEAGDNCNYDGYVNSRYTIAVGSHGFHGGASSYSEPCASLIITAPASGEGRRLLMGAAGTSQCEQMFSGSSGSAALAGGVLGLLLQQRPDFSWRDVQNALIESAMPVGEDDPNWTENGAGYRINHRFGFGRLDAESLMQVAETLSLLPEEVTLTDLNQTPTPIPDYGAAGEQDATSTIQVEEDIEVESVEVSIVISHRRRGQLGIELISPDETVSQLYLPHTIDRNADINWTFTTMRCWGESSRGVWKLRVYDNERGIVGDLNSWVLNIHGHRRSPIGQK